MATQAIGGTFESAKSGKMAHPMSKSHSTPYLRFAAMVGLSFIAMYILMYSMVNVFSNVFNSINQVYMAGLMATPMAVIEIFLMSKMYPNKKANLVILIGSVLLFAFFWVGIRKQIGVHDQQFVRSMIPHHSGAILMCNEANIADPELSSLCGRIVKGQQEEIDQMKAIMVRLSK